MSEIVVYSEVRGSKMTFDGKGNLLREDFFDTDDPWLQDWHRRKTAALCNIYIDTAWAGVA